MAFKTDKIKLRLYTGSDPTAENGELAIVDNVLRLKQSNGSWVDVSGGGGGGLANVVEDTSPQLGGNLDANGNNILMKEGTIYTDTAETSSINTAKVTSWDSTSTLVGSNSANWNSAYGWGDHSTQGYLTSETSHANVLVDEDFATAGLMTTDGAGNYSITTNNFSTVDDLNDLSDVSTPATLDGTHVGKVVGVVSGGGQASILTLDHAGITDTYVTQNIYFEVDGQEYWIMYDGGNPVSSETGFTLQGSGVKRAIINGFNITNNGMGSDIRTLMAVFENGTESSAYTITGSGTSMIMTANSTGAASNIDYPSTTASNLEAGMSVTQVEGLDPQYQYELINTSSGADPNWNYVQNTDWTTNISLSTNTASNLTWVNTANPNSYSLEIRQPSDYGTYAVITIMNASNNTMDISRVDTSFSFNCQQLNPPLNNTITLDAFQKAILVRTASSNWDVVLASI